MAWPGLLSWRPGGNGAGRSTNAAATANGGTATAQNFTPDSAYPGMHFQPSYANDGGLYANPPYGDQYWRDEHGLPSWVEVDFSGSKTIDGIDVFTVADNPAYFAYPDINQQFNYYGATSYDVQYWNGSSWVTVTGGSVTNNNLIWRRFSFTAITTSKIRVKVNAAVDSVARIVEVQAWTPVTTGPTAKINWMVSDQLGTPRMVFDESGSLGKMSRHDYLPFGEELTATQGLRTTTLGYMANDGVRQQFTSKERDGETGLDYFGARYYANTQGRFNPADSFGGRISNPQSLNLYSYVLNNPLKWNDPTGHQKQDLDKKKEAQKYGYDIDENGALVNKSGGAVIQEEVTVTTKFDHTLPWSGWDFVPVAGQLRQMGWDEKNGNDTRALGHFFMASVEGATLVSPVRSGGKFVFRIAQRMFVREVIEETGVALIEPVGGVINIGGVGEISEATNVNLLVDRGAEGIPNLIVEDGSNIGNIFQPGSATQVVASKVPFSGLNLGNLASGAYRVLAPGGRVMMNITTNSTAQGAEVAAAFSAAGFREVAVESYQWGIMLRAIR